jgi:peptidoglycan/LPS O-acetylase OafA/YrhL
MGLHMKQHLSLYLDLIRPMLAVFVLLSHLSEENISQGHFRLFDGAGTPAVDMFFVLSGLVIAFVTQTRETNVVSYGLARASRLYSVVIPALLIGLVVDLIGQTLDPAIYAGSNYQPYGKGGALLLSSVFLNEIWDLHRFPGSNSPFWSLGFEALYYVAYGTLLFGVGRWRWILFAATLCIMGPKVASLFPAWLLGVLCFHLCRRFPESKIAAWVLTIAPVVGFVALQYFGPPRVQQFTVLDMTPLRISSLLQDYCICILFCLHIVGINQLGPQIGGILQRFRVAIRWIAGATFTIYLLHHPILWFLTALSPWPTGSAAGLIYVTVGTILACFAVAEISERRKRWWGQKLQSIAARVTPETIGWFAIGPRRLSDKERLPLKARDSS